MELGKQIQLIRKENKLSQEQFGLKFHVTRQTVSNWENEKSYPDLQTLIEISDSYNISLDKLLKETPKMVEDYDSAIADAKRARKTLVILIVIICLIPIIWIGQLFVRLHFSYKATPFEERNVSETNARMYVNLKNQTPSDAIVYTYDKEEYDKFSIEKKKKIFDIVNGKMEGDIPSFRMDQGESLVRFTFQDNTGHNIMTNEIPVIRIFEDISERTDRKKIEEIQLSKDSEGYFFDLSQYTPTEISEFGTIYMEIEYPYSDFFKDEAVSVTALTLFLE